MQGSRFEPRPPQKKTYIREFLKKKNIYKRIIYLLVFFLNKIVYLVVVMNILKNLYKII